MNFIKKILINLLLIKTICNSTIIGTKKISILDKSHLKIYAQNWIQLWKSYPSPLSDLRINECWKSIIWCTNNEYKNYAHCLSYKHNNYFIFVHEDYLNECLKVMALIENPENIYDQKQIEQLHKELVLLAKYSNYTINYKPLKNWSHGYYFYEYNENE
tara:strand:- start:598 stop:1074 length:477 start_codon:yes stop_codon:yes gene_type:complete